jgi:2-keto-4-pentenoate hydratase/2-oxohepta-3-ene-1,7-dioic acid hydratase in catechol pathway
MRLLSCLNGGLEHLLVRDDDRLIDLAGAHAAAVETGALTGGDGAALSTMLSFLNGGKATLGLAREVVTFAREHEVPLVEESAIALLPVVPRPPKTICVARNYAEHAAEANLDVLEVPNLFIRFPRSLIAHGDSVLVPEVSRQVDWEAELAVVIGEGGRHIPAAEAYEHVAGYAPFNDVSIRDWQLRKPPVQFGAGKNFDGSGPFGPELVTRDEVPDAHALRIELKVDGETMQSSSTASMIFNIPTLIEFISQFTTLEPGDVIATGTPSGVGHFRNPPKYLVPGEVVRVEIEGMAALVNPVRAEAG